MNGVKLPITVLKVGAEYVVYDKEAIKYLCENGNFGKGSLSRTTPQSLSGEQFRHAKPERTFGRRSDNIVQRNLYLLFYVCVYICVY